MFHDEDLRVRPHPAERRGRNPLEHMVHQCIGENNWFRDMLGIEGSAALPPLENRSGFIHRYSEDSQRRLEALRGQDEPWWEQPVQFFDVPRSRAWVMVRRIAHTAHHRGQQLAMLRMLGRNLYINYGPTADTGGLAWNGARVIYANPEAEPPTLPGPGRQNGRTEVLQRAVSSRIISSIMIRSSGRASRRSRSASNNFTTARSSRALGNAATVCPISPGPLRPDARPQTW